MKKKKKSAVSIFIRNFVRSIVLIFVLLLFGYGSFRGTIYYYDKVGVPTDNKAAKIVRDYFGEVKVDDISKNLILSVDEDDGQIKSMVLEIFNKSTSNFDYVTIPMKLQFTISNEFYQKLFNAGSEAPQIIRMSKADEYFSEETLYQYVVVLLEDYLNIDISYYTVVPQKKFRKMFKKKVQTVQNEEELLQYNVYYLTDSYLEEVRKLTDADSMEQYIKEAYETCESSLSLKGKLEYVDSYLEGNIDCAYVHSIFGKEKSGYFEADKEKSVELIQQLVDNTIPYSVPQKTDKVDVNGTGKEENTGYVVEILNASNITGLAAAYQQDLINAGYQVADIGNYTQGTLTQTKIIVKEESIGQGVLKFFPNARIEIGTLREGLDIQVLLGTDSAK